MPSRGTKQLPTTPRWKNSFGGPDTRNFSNLNGGNKVNHLSLPRLPPKVTSSDGAISLVSDETQLPFPFFGRFELLYNTTCSNLSRPALGPPVAANLTGLGQETSRSPGLDTNCEDYVIKNSFNRIKSCNIWSCDLVLPMIILAHHLSSNPNIFHETPSSQPHSDLAKLCPNLA